MILDDVTVRIADLRAAEVCLPGARRWLSARNYSWPLFLRDGIPAGMLAGVDDARIAPLLAVAQARYMAALAATDGGA